MNVRQTLVGFIGGLTLAFAAEQATGYAVTWEFAAEVTFVVDLNNLLGGTAAANKTWGQRKRIVGPISDEVPRSGLATGEACLNYGVVVGECEQETSRIGVTR